MEHYRRERVFSCELVERAFVLAENILGQEAINPSSRKDSSGRTFKDIYGPEVEKDFETVQRIEAQIGKEEEKKNLSPTWGDSAETLRKRAFILEAIIYQEAELSEWFGPFAITIKTSKFDDLLNKVDSVIEFQDNGLSLTLALDVTFGAALDKKIKKIKNEIRADLLTRVKYFYSELLDRNGKNCMGEAYMPRVIIGASRETVDALIELWMSCQDTSNTRRGEDKKKLSRHPIQMLFLEEARTQLHAFGEYARKIGRINIADACHDRLQVIEGVIREKKEQGLLMTEELKKDRILVELRKQLVNFWRIVQQQNV